MTGGQGTPGRLRRSDRDLADENASQAEGLRDEPNPNDQLQDNLRPQSENNPAYGQVDDDEAYTGRPDQGVTRRTGAGAGGATESKRRVVNREGIHLPRQGSR